MGLRGELFSSKVLLQNRTYFFNVKENRMGDLYLNIVESKNRDEGGFDRQSVILFADDLQEFLKGFDEALRVMEKEVREKRHQSRTARGPKTDDKGAPGDKDAGGRSTGGRNAGRGKYSGSAARVSAPRTPAAKSPDRKRAGGTRTGGRPTGARDGDPSERPRRGSSPRESSPRGKRIVVKKK